MSNDVITIDVSTRPGEEQLELLIGRMEDASDAMAGIAGIMHNAIEKNFDTEGRRLGIAWVPLAPATVLSKFRRGKSAKKLQEDRTLYQSISSRSAAKEAVVAVIAPYAAAHQFGFFGQVAIGAHTRSDGTRVEAHTREMRLPARPYLRLGDQDLDDMIEMLADFAEAED